MKRLFYLGLFGLVLFEALAVYFIMPMPGSQRMESLGLAYFLYGYRWIFRGLFVLAIVAGSRAAFRIKHVWIPATVMLLVIAIVGFVNFRLSAESMFHEPRELVFKNRAENAVDLDSQVLCVARNGDTKAFPIRFLVYHHQVRASVGGSPVLVTYCSVCRTGRAFEPIVQGHADTFRLVGMDHFNAMFEDATTKSWWRQATGVAVAGPLEGASLPEVDARQLTLRKCFELHPTALVMQPDDAAKENYDPLGRFERGESKSELTGTDRASWNEKSWVVGVSIGAVSKAYDWNRLLAERVINDVVGETPIVLALGEDRASFVAFERPQASDVFSIAGDVLSVHGRSFDFEGREVGSTEPTLRVVTAHQEFWHSWRTFHPGTLRYEQP